MLAATAVVGAVILLPLMLLTTPPALLRRFNGEDLAVIFYLGVFNSVLSYLAWNSALAAIGNAPDAFGQTWHLPCCDDRPTYRTFVTLACEAFGRPVAYRVIGKWTLAAAGLFSRQVREIRELLPRYAQDNLFDSTKFKRRFPRFEVTTYREGLGLIRRSGVGERTLSQTCC